MLVDMVLAQKKSFGFFSRSTETKPAFVLGVSDATRVDSRVDQPGLYHVDRTLFGSKHINHFF